MGYGYITGTRVAVAPGLPEQMSADTACQNVDVVDSEGRFVPFVMNYSPTALHSLALDYTGQPIQLNGYFVVVSLSGDFAVVPKGDPV